AGAGHAQARVICPVDPVSGALNQAAPATVSLFQNGQDVTDTWLPSWTPAGGGQPVFVVFNFQGVVTAPSSPPTLVPPPANPVFDGTTNTFLSPPTTSAYPGNCTNYGSDTGADYAFSAIAESVTLSIQGYRLTPNDCGGMAVVRASFSDGHEYTFIVPQDTN